MRQGWKYLSDDAVLIQLRQDIVEAFALRKHFYIDASVSTTNADLPLDDIVVDQAGGHRRRIRIEETSFAQQHLHHGTPEVIVSTRIVPEPHSTLMPLRHRMALKHLLEGSGSQLFDRRTMRQQFEVLNALQRQCRNYELRAGSDLCFDATSLIRLLNNANAREASWPALLSS
jgi:hypothetical protein